MTKPKGCLSVVAVLLVIGGLVGVFAFSRIRSTRIRPVDDELRPVSLEYTDTEQLESRIVIPETVILTESPGTSNQDDAVKRIREPIIKNYNKAKSDKDVKKSQAQIPSKVFISGTAKPVSSEGDWNTYINSSGPATSNQDDTVKRIREPIIKNYNKAKSDKDVKKSQAQIPSKVFISGTAKPVSSEGDWNTYINSSGPATSNQDDAVKRIREPIIKNYNKAKSDKDVKKSQAQIPSKVFISGTAKPVSSEGDWNTSINSSGPFTWQKLTFDPYGSDTLVLIHIQKTGGTDFLRHLITATKNGRYLCSLSDKAQKGINNNSLGTKGVFGRGIMCPRDRTNPMGEQWLVSEKNLGWICQLHTSYSEFKVCLPKLKDDPRVNTNSHFFYSTILRHPVLRYMSEYLHFKRNATWARRRVCGRRKVSDSEMPPCYPGFYSKKPWLNVTIEKFLSCRSNWANNRQTRMLADLESLGCYGYKLHPPEEKDRLMLQSAKDNLRNFAFFGLTEYQSETRLLFERLFGIKLRLETQQRAMSALHSAPILQDLWNNSQLYDKIAKVNKLDMELYEYALELFSERVKTILGLDIDPDSVSEQIVSMNSDDLRRTANKFKKFNLHREFEKGHSKPQKPN